MDKDRFMRRNLRKAWIAPAGVVSVLVVGAIVALAADPAAKRSGPALQPAPVLEGENQTELLIAQALDQPTDIEFKDVPIRTAMLQLSEKTGVPIEVETGTVRFLPYGSETMVTATIKGQPLRESLAALLRPIGLVFVPQENRIAVRASWDELARIEDLYTRPWSEELFKSLKFQFQDAPTDDLAANREALHKAAAGVGSGTAADVLDLATARMGATWYPEDDRIVVLSQPKQIERQLERPITVEYKAVSLTDVLRDLAEQAGVMLKLEPGVLAALPAPLVERYSMSVNNTSVRQALEIVAGQTGLGYFIEPDGVRIAMSGTAAPVSTGDSERIAQSTVAALRSNPWVATISMPDKDGVRISFLMRESDLPEEVNELRRAHIRQAVERMKNILEQAAASQPQD
jgi:hypothetical protein